MKVYNGRLEYTIVLNFTVNAETDDEAMETAVNSSSFKPEFITNKEILGVVELENYNLGLISSITRKQTKND